MFMEEALQQLDNVDFDSDFLPRELDQIAEDLNTLERPWEAIDPVLRFIEDHPDEDLGNPGPLVRFLEQFIGKGFEQKLVASLRRMPTMYTAWMLNRLLNGLQVESRPPYVHLMKELSHASDEEVASQARSYLEKGRWTYDREPTK